MVSMYQVSIPPCLRALGALAEVLAKGDAHCAARGIEPSVMLQSRLYPDMFPLTRQVQIAADSARRLGARLTRTVPPSVPDVETSFIELQQRLATTIAGLRAITPEQLEGTEDMAITIPIQTGELKLTGLEYAQGFAIPNLYFHAVTAYDILRHNGVELAKKDFLGAPRSMA